MYFGSAAGDVGGFMMVVKDAKRRSGVPVMLPGLYVGQRIVRGLAKLEAENNSIRTIGTSHKPRQTMRILCTSRPMFLTM